MTRRLFLLAAATAALCGAQQKHWTVAGQDREALVFTPASTPTAVVFVFHGHGGSSQQAARSFHLHTLLPQAIVIYPQGLNTPGQLTDPAGRRPGWQAKAGDQEDRDLKFFDAMLAEYRAPGRKIYVTGHSNGGGFTYLLWAHRGEAIAAVAPSGAVAQRTDLQSLKPKPVLHIAGKNDPLVRFAWQEAMIAFLQRHNPPEPVETYLYDGGHQFPPEAPAKIAAFFQAH